MRLWRVGCLIICCILWWWFKVCGVYWILVILLSSVRWGIRCFCCLIVCLSIWLWLWLLLLNFKILFVIILFRLNVFLWGIWRKFLLFVKMLNRWNGRWFRVINFILWIWCFMCVGRIKKFCVLIWIDLMCCCCLMVCSWLFRKWIYWYWIVIFVICLWFLMWSWISYGGDCVWFFFVILLIWCYFMDVFVG